MRVLVYPHDLNMGGSQTNAIELAAAVSELGHECIIYGRRGTLCARVDELGLEFIEAPDRGRRPSPRVARDLERLVRERSIDIVHGYEWPPVLDAVLAARTGMRARVLATVMSMSVPPFIPRSVPLVVGTAEIAAFEGAAGRVDTTVIEPPVDLSFNAPDPAAAERFRSAFGLHDDRLNVVAVTRFALELKLEGTLAAIDVIGRLATRAPIRLVLVGDGPAKREIEARASAINRGAGRGTVVLTGQLDDPRPAYASADVCLGMGGSALRALSFGTPLIVQGERGFWRTLTPESVDQFLWSGWYGVGEGRAEGPVALERELCALIGDRHRRESLGAFGLQLVRERFSLVRAAELQADVYRRAMATPVRGSATREAEALIRYSVYYAGKRIRRAMRSEAADDFNARPVAARARAGGR
ncbi:glycosyltransferase [Agrococcus sp. TF02-05]|uniref:glycosyltransferase n=1 Tax=Agrococcus sp. TF02-05 TaxID=2815211 RepID=UPI001AA0F7CA|nr:glycosyltransferase [Agrococcus sp. TF02-05]MBO1769114.1 glycosyltransferase [Agrococcus sp. TF02-05]